MPPPLQPSSRDDASQAEMRFRKRSSQKMPEISIAAPCAVPWDSMEGDDRVRTCDQCELPVYNITRMSPHEVRDLVDSGTERICGRIFRRPDGTVLTKNCPAGLRALRLRASGRVAALTAAVIGLFSVGYGQSPDHDKKGEQDTERLCRTEKTQGSLVCGTVVDPTGAAIPGARIYLKWTDGKKREKVRKFASNQNGSFTAPVIAGTTYELTVKSEGFDDFESGKFKVKETGAKMFEVVLFPSDITVTVGIIVESDPQPIDMSKTDISTTIKLRDN